MNTAQLCAEAIHRLRDQQQRIEFAIAVLQDLAANSLRYNKNNTQDNIPCTYQPSEKAGS